jgi:hypothetical protein
MTEPVQRGIGIAIGLIAHFLLLNSWGAALLKPDEPYLIGGSVLVVILIILLSVRFAPRIEEGDTTNLPNELLVAKVQRVTRYDTARTIALMIAYAFGAGGIFVLLFY